MSDAIISVSNLGKKYRIRHQVERQRYVALRDVIAQKLAAPFHALFRKNGSTGVPPASFGNPPKASAEFSTLNSQPSTASDHPSPVTRPSTEDFWALRNVSFEVKQGEVVGIIGRNGAGKSTLLKILSLITEPTEGRVRIRGRVACLLEVGTGFHPELTGRENVFLNGAILGMHRAEIKKKFDEIVAFAEIERFLDTPVKRYSSGMYVRLAFAVAAHLEPEILIVDEVLAVGDARFQKKCLGKMDEVAKGGRTVLFVSHNMSAVTTLCSRAMQLEQGQVVVDDLPAKVASDYLNTRATGSYCAQGPPPNCLRLERLWFSDMAGATKETFANGEPVAINVEIHDPTSQPVELEFAFFDGGGRKLWNFTHGRYRLPPIAGQVAPRVRATFFVPELHLSEVFVHVGLRALEANGQNYVDHISDGLRYMIQQADEQQYRERDSLIRCRVDFKVMG
jgi:lipopolysaccharide transport system ATP-binding protein